MRNQHRFQYYYSVFSFAIPIWRKQKVDWNLNSPIHTANKTTILHSRPWFLSRGNVEHLHVYYILFSSNGHDEIDWTSLVTANGNGRSWFARTWWSMLEITESPWGRGHVVSMLTNICSIGRLDDGRTSFYIRIRRNWRCVSNFLASFGWRKSWISRDRGEAFTISDKVHWPWPRASVNETVPTACCNEGRRADVFTNFLLELALNIST